MCRIYICTCWAASGSAVWAKVVPELPQAIERRLRVLPEGLRDHIERSREVGRGLARRFGVDEAKVDLGVAAHDLARAMKPNDLLREAGRLGLGVHPVEEIHPVLLHGAVAARFLEHEDGLTDSDVLDAVRWHTTGRRGMGEVAKVVFLADKLDPVKVERYAYLEGVASALDKGLDDAILRLLDQELAYFLEEGMLVHPEGVELRNELIMRKGKGPP